MDTQPRKTRFIPALEVSEGAGVTVHRTIGTPALRNFDPFLMLDHFNSDNADDYIAGFPSHPHRGFCTFTYMLNGNMQHKDSMGNTGNLGPGSAQWMKAASGVIHSEMPQQENGLMRGFQLWINLPAVHKMDAPEYQEYSAAAFPVVETDGCRVKVLMGQFADVTAPIVDGLTHVSYLDVQVEPHAAFTHTPVPGHNSLLYVFQGQGQLNGQPVSQHTLIALGSDDHAVAFAATGQGARFILVSGQPIGEPVVQYGPFVMNTREEINQAVQDYQSSQFVRSRARMQRDVS
jgi:redox-sensitive bicupin YhaK (pirin superfamily)